MLRISLLTLLLFFLAVTNSLAGFSGPSDSSFRRHQIQSTMAAVQLEDKKVYKLVVSMEFITKPKDLKFLSTDAYSQFTEQLSAECKSVALQRIFESGTKEFKVSGFANLKNSIEADCQKLVETTKKALIPEDDVRVIFSITDMYLLEPK